VPCPRGPGRVSEACGQSSGARPPAADPHRDRSLRHPHRRQSFGTNATARTWAKRGRRFSAWRWTPSNWPGNMPTTSNSTPRTAGRADPAYLMEMLQAAIDAETPPVVNIPDTTGYAVPEQYGRLIRTIREQVPNIGRATISVHCHDDSGTRGWRTPLRHPQWRGARWRAPSTESASGPETRLWRKWSWPSARAPTFQRAHRFGMRASSTAQPDGGQRLGNESTPE